MGMPPTEREITTALLDAAGAWLEVQRIVQQHQAGDITQLVAEAARVRFVVDVTVAKPHRAFLKITLLDHEGDETALVREVALERIVTGDLPSVQ